MSALTDSEPRRKFTVTGSGISWSGGLYTIKKDKATPIGAAHKAARRIWREAEKRKIKKEYFNFIMREIGKQDTYTYRAYRVKLDVPKVFTRHEKEITSYYDYVAVPCGKQELN